MRRKTLHLGFSTLLLLAASPLGAQTFTRITDATNPVVQFGGSTLQYAGASWIDADGDGDDDLYLCGPGLFRNDGGGTFVRIVGPYSAQGFQFGSTWGDVDNDGDVDAYVTSTGPIGSSLYLNQGGLAFTKLTTAPIGQSPDTPAWGCAFGDMDNDGLLDLVAVAPEGYVGTNVKNRLFHNLGGGQFARLDTAAMSLTSSTHTTPAWSDFDDDGLPELWIGAGPVNGTTARDYVYVNRSDESAGWFERLSTGVLGTDLQDGQAYTFVDYDNDRDLDVFLTNYVGTTGGMVNRLYRNDGGGTYTRLTGAQAGAIATDAQASLAAVWQDFDNDGDIDCLVANDFSAFTNRYYRNNGNGAFSAITVAGLTVAGPHYSAASGDWDGDGKMDLFVCGSTTTFGLYRNTTANTNGWIEVKPAGVASNRSAIGARVYVHAVIGGLPRWQMREISAQNSFNGMSTLTAHFGLGDASMADTVVVEFPSGLRMTRTAIASGSRIEVIEEAVTSVDIAVIEAVGDADGAHVSWWLPQWVGHDVLIERAQAPDLWEAWTRVAVNLEGRVDIVDRTVEVGHRYGYRVHVPSSGALGSFGETWVSIPAGDGFGIALAGTNPSAGAIGLRVRLAPEGGDATVSAFDVRGRRVAHAVLSGAGGEQTARLGEDVRLAPGVYLVRLTQGARTATCRAVVIE